jgi:uncharacterized protein YegL
MHKKVFFLLFIFTLFNPVFSDDCSTQVKSEEVNNFIIIADRSGSMHTDDALLYSMLGMGEFLKNTRKNDWVSLISFSDDVSVDQRLTQNKQLVFDQVKSLRAGGGTRLYDAIATGIQILSKKKGRKVIVFLTDGIDNSSQFTVRDLEQMNVGEDIFLYGIGLGTVDEEILKRITSISRGDFTISPSSSELENLYTKLQNSHYSVSDNLVSSGIYSITSIPSAMPVTFDGNQIGFTPIKMVAVKPGPHKVDVIFPKGEWSCSSDLMKGHTAYITARESDLPNDLILETAPTNSAVFVDDSYVGFSSMIPSKVGGTAKQLRIRGLSPGVHKIRIVPAPETGLMDDKAIEFEIQMSQEPLFIRVDVFWNQYNIMDISSAKVLKTIKVSNSFSKF